jgi:DNA-binding NtrC family response regulator
MRICLIENDPDICESMKEVLETEGKEAIIFSSAVAFLDSIDTVGKLNYIVSDFYMPGLTGLELYQKLKSRSDFKDIPFILMSARKVKSSELKNFPSYQFLQKPFSLDELLGLLK